LFYYVDNETFATQQMFIGTFVLSFYPETCSPNFKILMIHLVYMIIYKILYNVITILFFITKNNEKVIFEDIYIIFPIYICR